MKILEAVGVSKTYRRGGFFSRSESVQVLRGVELSVSQGECVGVVGRSGSGKSTLGRLLLGLEAPSAGEVRILGETTTDGRGKLRLTPEQRQAAQVVFQDAVGSVNPRLTAGTILSEPLRNLDRLRGAALSERVVELLEQVGLNKDDAAKHPGHFSGGQLQRLSIARALAARPRCIILDEAVSSLDMLMQARILDLLDVLRRERGVAYLFVTHDLRLVRRFCDRAVAMENGRLEPFDLTGDAVHKMSDSLRELAEAILPSCPGGGFLPTSQD
ncbi:ABC transporter ATP-binding protein [Desulfohalovibrio reitneri]|uniref:ABC transporter ATP-binding protein n=1 Tax=Desulfohalovibrio reitneri TaxID=1307759 RepID=UPI0004A6F2A6|nr:ABC transporter ATP-binding protein [Desulfohalovibrio reitneri]